MRKSAGFTLLELMIVLVIMATLSVLSSQSIQQAIKNKIKLQKQIDDVSQVRDALRVIERDVNLAFHYSDLETELKELIKKKRKVTSTAATVPPAPGATTTTMPNTNPEILAEQEAYLNSNPEGRVDPTTHFVGKDNELYFTTLNASRLSEGTQQADFIKVGYRLQSCRRPGENMGSSNCLVRKSSNVAEGDVTRQGDGIALLTDVTEFKLRYFGKGKQDWNNDWDSKQGDGIAKGRFPDAVEISITVEKGEGDKKKKVSMQIVAPIRFTNNPIPDANAALSNQGPPP